MLFLVGFLICFWCLHCTNGADLRPPNITFLSPPFPYINMQKNTVLSLACKATGEKPLDYHWQHNGSPVIQTKADRISSYLGRIVIGSLQPDDQGVYRCVVSNKLGKVFSKDCVVRFSYINDFLLPDTDRNTKTITSEIGTLLQIDCPSFGQSNMFKYSWGGANKDGTVFVFPVSDRVMVSSSGSLVFAWLKQTDVDLIQSKGGISCIIQNMDRTELRFSHKHNISISGIASSTEQKPEMKEGLLSSYEAVEGEELTLRCTASGRPTPSISWLKNGNDIPEGSGYSFDENHRVLRLSPVVREMSAQYKCIAESQTKIGKPMVASSTTTVYVKSKPAWITKPDQFVTEAFMSKDYSLNCKASGNPAPVYTWYKNNKKLDKDSPKYKMKEHTLTVTNLTPDDKGVYQCTANNKYGRSIAGVYLNVVDLAPTFEDIQFGPFKIYLGQRAVLPCNPQAAPAPNKTQKVWKKNGDNIVYDDKKHAQSAQGDLIILNVDYTDEANYTCHVTNIAGRAQATAVALVSKEPVKSLGSSKHQLSLINCLLSFPALFIVNLVFV